MRKYILLTGLLILYAGMALAYRIPKPDRITAYDEKGVVVINDNFEKLWDITNGRYSMNVNTTVPSTNATEGDFKAFHNGTNQVLYAYINGSWRGFMPVGNITAGNYVNIASDGTLTLKGNATTWEDLRFPVNALQKNPGTSKPDYVAFKNGTWAYTFATTESVSFAVQVPHAWKAGSALNPHIHWSPIDTNTGTVIWQLEYTVASINGTYGNTKSLNATQAAGGTAYTHQLVDLGDIDMANNTGLSTMLMCNLSRIDSGAGANYTNEAALLEIDFHYEVDSLGSSQEYVK